MNKKLKCRICSTIGPTDYVLDRYYQLDCCACNSTSFFFQENYHYGQDEKYSDIAYLDNYELRWAHEKILRYIIRNKVNIKSLEVGCFNGQFVNELRSHGIVSYGTDINTQAIKYGMNRYFPHEKSILSDSISDFLSLCNTVILIDVLEHMEDPMDFVNNLPSNINRLVISSPLAKKLIYDKSDFPPHHYSRIDPFGLINELSNAGFNSVDGLYLQSSFLLLVRNAIGRLKYGWNKKWYEGSPVFTIQSRLVRKIYKLLENMTSPIFKLFGLRYSAFVLIINR